MIVNGMRVESLDKTVKGQVLASDYDKDYARVYNWLHDNPDEMFVETKLSTLLKNVRGSQISQEQIDFSKHPEKLF